MRTKNIQASRSRTDNFISTVSQTAHLPIQQSSSPLYGTPNRGTPSPGADLLSLNPVGDQQLLVMEEAQPQNSYIQERGQAIEAIESTITELGSIFGQLASMVSEQGNMVRSPSHIHTDVPSMDMDIATLILAISVGREEELT